MLLINLKEEHVFVCMSRCMCVWGSVINGAQREERKINSVDFQPYTEKWIHCLANINISKPPGKHIPLGGKTPLFGFWKLYFQL